MVNLLSALRYGYFDYSQMFFDALWTIGTLVAFYKIFEKIGIEPWKGIIPFYNMYILCDVVYGDGKKFVYLLIPFYNVYYSVKTDMLFAEMFGLEKEFGIGLALLTPVFGNILAFGDYEFKRNIEIEEIK